MALVPGWLFDALQSYNPGFLVSGVAIAASGLMLFFIPMLQRSQLASQRPQKALKTFLLLQYVFGKNVLCAGEQFQPVTFYRSFQFITCFFLGIFTRIVNSSFMIEKTSTQFFTRVFLKSILQFFQFAATLWQAAFYQHHQHTALKFSLSISSNALRTL